MRRALETAGVGLIALAAYAALAPHGNVLPDESWLLDGAMRVAAGQVPHADFDVVYSPGRYWVLGAVLAVFPGSLLAVRLTWALASAAVVAAVHAIGRRWLGPLAALTVAATVTLMPGPWHKTLYTLVPMSSALAWYAASNRQTPVAAAAAGAVMGFGALFRQDVGVYSLLASLLSLGASSFPVPARAAGLRRAGALIAGFTAPILGCLLLLAPWVGPGEVLAQWVVDALADAHPEVDGDGGLLGVDRKEGAVGLVIALMAWLPVLLSGTLTVLLGRRAARGEAREDEREVLWMAALCLLASNQVFRHNVEIRFLQVLAPVGLLWAWSASRVAGSWPSARLPVTALATVGPAALVYGMLSGVIVRPSQLEYTGSPILIGQRDTPFDVHGTTFWFSGRQAETYERLQAALEVEPWDAEPFVVVRKPSLLYFLEDRLNPTRTVRLTPEKYVAEEMAPIEACVEDGTCPTVVIYRPHFYETDERWRTLLRERCLAEQDWHKEYLIWRCSGEEITAPGRRGRRRER